MSDINIIKRCIEENKNLIDDFIKSHFSAKGYDRKLSCNNFSINDAMLYTLINGGKRIRPIILLLVAESLGFQDKKKLLPFATAVELIHSYSLIHDDLPAMDNDNIRRGKPTNHIVYGEASAILAGDALLTEAFIMLTDEKYISGFGPEKAVKAIRELSAASGAGGLVGGQFLDVNSFDSPLTAEETELINKDKTASLIGAAGAMGAILSGMEDHVIENFRKFGIYVGLAFQTVDDILDCVGNKDITGKTSGIDKINKKYNIIESMGIDNAYALVKEYNKKAESFLDATSFKSDILINFTEYLTNRTN